jgi:hypothetical protein
VIGRCDIYPLSSTMPQSTHTDVRGSNFTDVGCDQCFQTINIVIANSTPEQTLHHLHNLDPVLQPPTCIPETLLQRHVLNRAHHLVSGSMVDLAIDVIVEIMHLIGPSAPSYDYQWLKAELESLYQILTLVHLAIQAYKYTPIGRNLASCVISEVEECCVVLKGLVSEINNC